MCFPGGGASEPLNTVEKRRRRTAHLRGGTLRARPYPPQTDEQTAWQTRDFLLVVEVTFILCGVV